jgi:protein-tyrosine phosphatase
MQNPSRSLNLAGASNFRDLGGYLGLNGRAVRWRRLFRSDHLAALTPDDRAVLSDLGVARAYDFRGQAERAAVPYDLPGVRSYSLAIEPTVVQRMKALAETGYQLTPQDTVGLMQQTYRAFVHDNSPRFAELFQHLLEDDAPLVFHCTAGKDRTGFAAALILLALGVPRAVVLQDYLLTNDLFRMPKSSPGLAPQAVLDVLWRVQEDFLEAAMQVVQADFGGMERYLTSTLGLDAARRERLVALYLQPAA